MRQFLPSILAWLSLGIYALDLAHFAFAAPGGAPPPEQLGSANVPPLPEVTVIGKFDKRTLNHVVNQFIESHAEPSAVISQIGRWREDVCPKVTGLQGPHRDFVSNGIIKLALEGITQKYRSLLGYYPTSKVKEATTFTHPIQAWYVTGSRTLNGLQPPKMGAGRGPPSAGGGAELGVPQPPSAIQPLALTHIASLDNCSQLLSILKVFGKDCAAPPDALTASDAAYLKSLYAADLDTNLNIEQGDLRQRMLDAISRK